jgi:hypothetical protein
VTEIVTETIHTHQKIKAMGNGYFQYYKPKVLLGLVIYLVFAIVWAKENLGLSLSVTTVVAFILLLIEKYLWKIKPFSWMFWTEDFSGRYEGELEYKYKDENCKEVTGRLKHIKIISQTASSVYVNSFTVKEDGSKSSVSENKGMYIEKTADGKHFNLIYNYLNEGNPALNLTTHYGTEIIKFIKKGNSKKLSGRYFTERLPHQTRGEFLELKWTSDNLEHEF